MYEASIVFATLGSLWVGVVLVFLRRANRHNTS